ncbi:NUDIX hydrolase [Paenibacillus methanolicus]|uniref:NUDIX domain-containing protein n=1 Tax=Paenibacillus methanolicus TaxID=582686 RepID=A0A5S5BZ71_9BACL|nr:NUDIX domain-containing protein [Paenibacillus methanolicus]TYP72357.1 NUDIX domain-containing protein [Paenibacillus methanolicus]
MTTMIDKIAWVKLSEGKLLGARSFGRELYYIPGGKREPGETDAEALAREIKEELSVRIIPETIKACGTFEAQADGKPEGVHVRLTCYAADADGELRPASEIEEIVWLTYADRERVSAASHLLFDRLKQDGLLV